MGEFLWAWLSLTGVVLGVLVSAALLFIGVVGSGMKFADWVQTKTGSEEAGMLGFVFILILWISVICTFFEARSRILKAAKPPAEATK